MDNTEIDQKLFDNIYRFVALCSTSEEYYFHISEGLIKLELKFVEEEYTAKNYHPKQIAKQVDRRHKELKRIHVQRQKFFSDFVAKFNVPPYDALIETYVDKLSTALTEITTENANKKENT